MSDQTELRRFAVLAHERELKDQLLQLFGKFDQWRRGAMDPFELNDEIKKHADGASRDLHMKYLRTPPETAVAVAVVTGVLREEDLTPECRALIGQQVKYLREKGQH